MRPDSKPVDQKTFIEEARRAQIVSCAVEVIAEVGYGQTSLARIAQRAGISKGVISYHFAGKDELIQQVAEYVVGNARAYMRPYIEAAPDAFGQIRGFIEGNLGFVGAHREQLLALGDILANARDANGSLMPDISGASGAIGTLDEFLRRGQKDGQFRAFSTRVMATSIRAALDAVSGQLIADPELDLRAYARDLVDLFHHATKA
ncbi:TetR/AcrR family transcriptional regulator [Fodinicola feengrottensis]|uniref:TetR family transcriptional regulator n=1 Tax=Fodinicola feengrottensis TaxID=435914 RepID=A0ABN2HT60_9ACTN|nr:TetR/AcrR family transcriptional regulator [Fodinicola feengrottensis]